MAHGVTEDRVTEVSIHGLCHGPELMVLMLLQLVALFGEAVGL